MKVELLNLQITNCVGPTGLSSEEVRERQERFGINEFNFESSSTLFKFLSYFWGPIPWTLAIVAVMLATMGYLSDSIMVLFGLVCASILGFCASQWEKHQIARLKITLRQHVHVKRDGEWIEVFSRELVPGDTIQLYPDIVMPADVCILEDDEPIWTDPLPMFDYMLPIIYHLGDTVFCGRIVKEGKSSGLVIATGNNTHLGQAIQQVLNTHTADYFFHHAVLKLRRNEISFRYYPPWED